MYNKSKITKAMTEIRTENKLVSSDVTVVYKYWLLHPLKKFTGRGNNKETETASSLFFSLEIWYSR